jgi:hypothetical protein
MGAAAWWRPRILLRTGTFPRCSAPGTVVRERPPDPHGQVDADRQIRDIGDELPVHDAALVVRTWSGGTVRRVLNVFK